MHMLAIITIVKQDDEVKLVCGSQEAGVHLAVNPGIACDPVPYANVLVYNTSIHLT